MDKSDQLHLRLSPDDLALWQRAAELSSVSLSEWVRHHLHPVARAMVEGTEYGGLVVFKLEPGGALAVGTIAQFHQVVNGRQDAREV